MILTIRIVAVSLIQFPLKFFIGSRETAFISAIQNAALVYVVTVGCSSGYLPECSCDLSKKGKESENGGWRWGGCR